MDRQAKLLEDEWIMNLYYVFVSHSRKFQYLANRTGKKIKNIFIGFTNILTFPDQSCPYV